MKQATQRPVGPFAATLLGAVPALLLAGLAAAPINGSAMTLRQLHAMEKTQSQGTNYANYYLVGTMEGILEAQQKAVRDGAAPTICPNAPLAPRIARQLLDAELRRNKDVYEADIPVPLVLENALTTVYPCVQ